ncbi:MAG: cyclic pyranopterin monophosphate synthase MoaC, partial [Deltaproteobacteria bacterium]|nr:cyclic pyranopterin monophosphate synthase MoaC [Deltaproteobacteria bacterium]
MGKLTHLDSEGRARMVDVTEKEETPRIAAAKGTVFMRPETLALILEKRVEKGDVFSVARVAGIMAAKKTPDLIPMCHPLNLSSVEIFLTPQQDPARVEI